MIKGRRMREIPLTQGKVALVDDEDYDRLARHSWSASKDRECDLWYAIRHPTINGKRVAVLMHREILGIRVDQYVDHRDTNGLNNTKRNLRTCTNSQNGANRRVSSNRRFKGTWKGKRSPKYGARIVVQGRLEWLGYFEREEDAARAYDAKAFEVFGEFARLNFPKGENDKGR